MVRVPLGGASTSPNGARPKAAMVTSKVIPVSTAPILPRSHRCLGNAPGGLHVAAPGRSRLISAQGLGTPARGAQTMTRHIGRAPAARETCNVEPPRLVKNSGSPRDVRG